VLRALQIQYKQSIFKDPITYDNKGIEISGPHNPQPIDVDVVPCQIYRAYHSYPKNNDPEYITGMRFKPRFSNEWWVNFPKLHYDNAWVKHLNYPETVRIFKNARRYYNKKYL